MDKFEKAKAIFLTTNGSLARASSVFFRSIEGHGAIPICMPVELMTRLAWVKKPMAAPDLPKHLVMASAYAALNPPVPLWRECLAEMGRRRKKGELSDADYYYLRSSREFRQALMDKTRGGETPFSAGTLDEVITHAKQSIQAEADKRATDANEQRLIAEGVAEEATRRAEGIDRVHRDALNRRGHRRGKVVGWGVAALVVAAFLVGILAAIPHFPLIEVKGGWRYAVWACLIIFVLSNIATGVKGLTISTSAAGCLTASSAASARAATGVSTSYTRGRPARLADGRIRPASFHLKVQQPSAWLQLDLSTFWKPNFKLSE
jgi:hypothetical protein